MSEVDARFIKRGLWTNVDRGNIMGKTITTDSTTGAIVIALMAVLSTMGRVTPSYCIDRHLKHMQERHIYGAFYCLSIIKCAPTDDLLMECFVNNKLSYGLCYRQAR
jgi:hypothetical protein